MTSFYQSVSDEQLRAGYYSVSFLSRRLAVVFIHKLRQCWRCDFLARQLFKLSSNLLRRLQPLFPRDTYILYDNCYETNTELVDCYSLFTYLRAHGQRAYYLLWRENPLYAQLQKSGQLDHVIVTKNDIHQDPWFAYFYALFWPLLRARCVIASFGGLRDEIMRFLLDDPSLDYVYINHGISLLKKLDPKIVKVQTPSWSNYFLVSSSPEVQFAKKYLGWDDQHLLPAGMPRWDRLKKIPHDGVNIFFFFTWRYSFQQLPKNEVNSLAIFRQLTDLFHHHAWQKMATQYHVNFYFAPHHFQVSLLGEKKFLPDDPHFHLIEPDQISHYIGQCDLFVTDYSSLFTDFMFLDIPVLFFIPDENDRQLVAADREAFSFARQQIDKYLFNYCANDQELITKITQYLRRDCQLEKAVQKKVDNFFFTRKNICETLIKLIEERQQSVSLPPTA